MLAPQSKKLRGRAERFAIRHRLPFYLRASKLRSAGSRAEMHKMDWRLDYPLEEMTKL
jgi:hypothetical protein